MKLHTILYQELNFLEITVMLKVLLVIHIFITLALVALILLQKSEGGALGMGGGNSMGGLLTGRGAANLLTKTTSIFATLFFVSCILLAIQGGVAVSEKGKTILDAPPANNPIQTPTPNSNSQPTVPVAQ